MTEQPNNDTDLAHLIGGLIHEIKNPLSTLSMNMQLLAEDFEEADDPKSRRIRGRIEALLTETKRLEEMLNGFLRYLKGSKLQLEEVNLNSVLEDIVEFIRPEAAKHGVEVSTFLSPEPPVIQADRNLIRQAVLNLTLNGCEAMPEGGELVLRTEAYDDAVKIRVIDTGGGISEESLRRLFDPFYTTKPNGTGLGLATAKRIVKAHGGKIDIESEVGKGTQVRISFPVNRL
ncbi:MAG: two-component system sensor histidine kinase NtrB [Planctomycetota bacterium]|jgi:signal transduction histidine kinase